jgi:hypothetical protein
MSSGHLPHQRSSSASGPRAESAAGDLAQRLAPLASDRASSAAQVVLETSAVLRDWFAERAGESDLDGAEIESGLARWSDEQAWRGACALWLDSLRRAWRRVAGREEPGRGAALLAEEMDRWAQDDERDAEGELRERATRRTPASPEASWNGEPFAPGRRLASRTEVASRAAQDLGPGETVLVTSWSETVALSLETAWREGRRPEVLLVEGAPDLDGRRMARRLARSGIPVTMAYDSALVGLVPRADRVWLSTEAIGAGLYLGRIGTLALLEECQRRDVPVRLLATSDKLVPGGELRLPSWGERETWLLWEDPPEGVRLEPQMFERVPIDRVEVAGGILSEHGRETAAALHLRSLRVDASPACGAPRSRLRAEAATSDPRT